MFGETIVFRYYKYDANRFLNRVLFTDESSFSNNNILNLNLNFQKSN